MKRTKYFSFFILLFSSLLLSCSDFIKKDIEIDSSDDIRKLVVSCSLENDLFYIRLGLSNPITAKETTSYEFIENAVVKLYENDRLMLEITKRDDYPEYYDPTYDPYYDPYYKYLLPYAVRNDIGIVPGKSYRLEVFLAGYPLVTSTVVAPEEPQIENFSLTTFPLIEKDFSRMAYAERLQSFYTHGSESFFQMNFTLNDNSATKDYYLFEAFETINDLTISSLYKSNRTEVASSDRILMQDNPDVVAEEWMNDPEINTFVFGQMLLTDLTFQGKRQDLSIMVGTKNLNYFKHDNCENMIRWYGESRVYQVHYKLVGVVKHICKEAYDFYRTFVLQGDEVQFFNEPVGVISNIEGGYGCFSVCTSKISVLAEYDVCWVSSYPY